jgi:microcompartment protein CcmL/EutN
VKARVIRYLVSSAVASGAIYLVMRGHVFDVRSAVATVVAVGTGSFMHDFLKAYAGEGGEKHEN